MSQAARSITGPHIHASAGAHNTILKAGKLRDEIVEAIGSPDEMQLRYLE